MSSFPALADRELSEAPSYAGLALCPASSWPSLLLLGQARPTGPFPDTGAAAPECGVNHREKGRPWRGHQDSGGPLQLRRLRTHTDSLAPPLPPSLTLLVSEEFTSRPACWGHQQVTVQFSEGSATSPCLPETGTRPLHLTMPRFLHLENVFNTIIVPSTEL